MTLNDEQELQIWREHIIFGRQYRKGAIEMSLDHEDIERVENIEDKIRTIEQHLDNISGTKLLSEVSQLNSRVTDLENQFKTLEEARKQKVQDINEQMEQTIDKLPMGIRGMVKKIVKGENGGEKDV